MLHKATMPEYAKRLNATVDVQRRLVEWLCKPETTVVDEAFLVALFSHEPRWATWIVCFAGTTREGKSGLDLMQAIAQADANEKANAFDMVQDHLKFEALFDASKPSPSMPKLKDRGLSTGTRDALKELLVRFYTLDFSDKKKGLPTESQDKEHLVVREKFVEEYGTSNSGDLQVCPLCDGHLEPLQVDHFYPKAQYPVLSCHPANLVPICGKCNGPGQKHENVPLDTGVAQPAANWFHPFLDSGYHDKLTVHAPRKAEVQVTADDEIARKFKNLDDLVGVRDRWFRHCCHEARRYQQRLRKREKSNGAPLTEEQKLAALNLQQQEQDLADDIGMHPFAIVELAFCKECLARGTSIFDDLIASAKKEGATG